MTSFSRADDRLLNELRSAPLKSVLQISLQREIGLADVRTLKELVRTINVLGALDVVHAHSSKAGALLRIGYRGPAKRIYTPHAFRTMDPDVSVFGRMFYGGIEGILGTLATDAVIAVAPDEAAHARGLGISASKVHTVINGVDAATDMGRAEARKALGLQSNQFVIGFVGRMCWQKNPQLFARSINVARLKSREIVGVMLGDGELLDETIEISGNGSVIRSGLDARHYLSAFDVLTMTSRYEGMPYVLLEALSAGLPIICTDISGASIAVHEGFNGTIVPASITPQDLGDIFANFAVNPLLRSMGEYSRQLGSAYSVDRMVDETLAIYGEEPKGAYQ